MGVPARPGRGTGGSPSPSSPRIVPGGPGPGRQWSHAGRSTGRSGRPLLSRPAIRVRLDDRRAARRCARPRWSTSTSLPKALSSPTRATSTPGSTAALGYALLERMACTGHPGRAAGAVPPRLHRRPGPAGRHRVRDAPRRRARRATPRQLYRSITQVRPVRSCTPRSTPWRCTSRSCSRCSTTSHSSPWRSGRPAPRRGGGRSTRCGVVPRPWSSRRPICRTTCPTTGRTRRHPHRAPDPPARRDAHPRAGVRCRPVNGLLLSARQHGLPRTCWAAAPPAIPPATRKGWWVMQHSLWPSDAGPTLTGIARASIAHRLGMDVAHPEGASRPVAARAWRGVRHSHRAAPPARLHRLTRAVAPAHRRRLANAVSAAFHDPRFPELESGEFRDVRSRCRC